MVIIDAVVLAGGHSSRLGGIAKAALVFDGQTLLERTLDVVAIARDLVVVGDAGVVCLAAPASSASVVRESPPFSGPAAGIAAGLDYLAGNSATASDFTLVLACDMPRVADAVSMLLAGLDADGPGAVAVSPDGQVQWLAGVYRTALLLQSCRRHRTRGDLENLPVRGLLDSLEAQRLTVPVGSTDDVDTPADTDRFGIAIPTRPEPLSASTLERL